MVHATGYKLMPLSALNVWPQAAKLVVSPRDAGGRVEGAGFAIPPANRLVREPE